MVISRFHVCGTTPAWLCGQPFNRNCAPFWYTSLDIRSCMDYAPEGRNELWDRNGISSSRIIGIVKIVEESSLNDVSTAFNITLNRSCVQRKPSKTHLSLSLHCTGKMMEWETPFQVTGSLRAYVTSFIKVEGGNNKFHDKFYTVYDQHWVRFIGNKMDR